MFNFTKNFANASLALLVGAGLHIAVIAISEGDHAIAMISAAILWVICAYALQLGSRWTAGIVFILTLFSAATFPLAAALSQTGMVSAVFFVIVLTQLVAATALFLALWRSKPVKR